MSTNFGTVQVLCEKLIQNIILNYSQHFILYSVQYFVFISNIAY